MQKVIIGDYEIGSEESPLTLFCGPCVIESEENAYTIASFLKNLFAGYPVQFIFKASYDKANRTSVDSFRGPGLKEGLRILKKIKDDLDIPILTDVHSPEDAIAAAEVCDVLQIPAFLCRQTDLIVAAASTGRVINVKKGQFVAPWDMAPVVEKIRSTGNQNILLTERGTTFGYNNLVTDFRSILFMQRLGYPVVFDATHSQQLPGGHGSSSSGQREFVIPLSKAALAVGCNALFAEIHPNPSKGKSDAATMLSFEELASCLEEWVELYRLFHPHVTCSAGQ